MKSFNNFLLEWKRGQQRHEVITRRLEDRLDQMYQSGVSQKKIDRAEMRLARRTGENEYDVEDSNVRSRLKTSEYDENSPRSESLEELMRNKAAKIYTHGHTPAMVGAEIRSARGDFMHFAVDVQPGVTDHELGHEAHALYIARQNLINRIRSKKK